MLTNEELVIAIQAGNQELMEQLWRQCYGFIRQQAIRWDRAWVNRADFELDDLINSGYFALCEACNAFQPGRGGFITLLSMYIKNEFADVVGCRTMAQKMEPLNSSVSYETPVASNTEGEEATMGDYIADPSRVDIAIDDKLFMPQLCELLHSKVAQLPEKERTAIEMRYWGNCPYQAIADALQCSITGANNAVKSGLRTLKKQDTDRTLRKLLDDLYYVDRNLYKRTGFGFWNDTGCSAQEYEVIRKEFVVKEKEKRLKKQQQKQEQKKREEFLESIMRVFEVDRETAEEYLSLACRTQAVNKECSLG